jgi:amino acid transporter
MNEVPSSTAASTRAPGALAHGELGTTDLVAQSLAVGPITSAALLGGVVAAKGGSAGPLFLLIVVVGVLGLGAILVMFARRYIHAGVMYEYVGRTLGPTAGISTAGFYYLAYIILGGPTRAIVNTCGSRFSQAASFRVSSATGSTGRSTSLPFSNLAPARTRATRCGAFTARQRDWAASISL